MKTTWKKRYHVLYIDGSRETITVEAGTSGSLETAYKEALKSRKEVVHVARGKSWKSNK